MHEFISDTASYGDLSRGHRIIDDHVRARMRELLSEVQSGKFAKEWLEQQSNPKNWKEGPLADCLQHPVEKVGAKLRSKMAWLSDNDQAQEDTEPFVIYSNNVPQGVMQ